MCIVFRKINQELKRGQTQSAKIRNDGEDEDEDCING